MARSSTFCTLFIIKHRTGNGHRLSQTPVASRRLVRHLVDRIDGEPARLSRSDLGDVFVRRKAAERLEPTGEIVGRHEVGEVHP